jgi:hypothetical protein
MASIPLLVAIGKGVVDLAMYIRERRQARKAKRKPAKPCPPPAPRARGLQ